MNATNRGLNRVLLGVTGLLLVAAGAAAVALVAVPAVTAAWRAAARNLEAAPQPWVAAPVVGQVSWLVLGVAAIAAVLVVLLLVFVGRQGGGRTAAALERKDGTNAVRVDLAVPRALLEEHLGSRSEFAGVRIAAYEVRGTPMLQISARCRRGVSPDAVAGLIGRAVRDLEAIVGTDVPALVRLSGGFRAGAVRTD